MPHLPDKINTNLRCSPSRGSLDPVTAGVLAMASLDSSTSMAYPRSEDCLIGRSRCGMEGSLSPKRLNAIANAHDSPRRAGLQYEVNDEAMSRQASTWSNSKILHRMQMDESFAILKDPALQSRAYLCFLRF
jgi:hypothetical protein